MILINIGNAGVHNACLGLLCHEHQVDLTGKHSQDLTNGNITALFNETDKGTFIPCSIFLDLDPLSIDEVKVGPYEQFCESF
jgi:hypothetical protein